MSVVERAEALKNLKAWLEISSQVWSDCDLDEEQSIEVELAVCTITKYLNDKFNKTLGK